MAKRPCVDCGTPTTGTRCRACELPRQRIRNRKRHHYQGDYQKRRRRLREQQPDGPCWICGQTIAPGEWTADHLKAGDPTSPLAPAHRSCNSSRGRR